MRIMFIEAVRWYREARKRFPEDLSYFLNDNVLPHFADLETLDGNEAVTLLNRLLMIAPRCGLAEGQFLSALRELVDQWLLSGKNENGYCPHERKIPLQTLREFIRRNPPHLELQTPSGPLNLELEPSPVKKTDPLLAARDAATFLFLKLMDSPARARLSRCDACRTYFARARMPKRDTPIYHGCFCPKCKGKGGAKRTSTSRERKKREIVEHAAKWSLHWKPTRRHGSHAAWVARKVNENLPRHLYAITGKWVTQNQAAIEAEVTRFRAHEQEKKGG